VLSKATVGRDVSIEPLASLRVGWSYLTLSMARNRIARILFLHLVISKGVISWCSYTIIT